MRRSWMTDSEQCWACEGTDLIRITEFGIECGEIQDFRS